MKLLIAIAAADLAFTAVVTALLSEKGESKDGTSFDKKLWFSDTYVSPKGWKYVFGQASLPLPI